RHTRSYGDWSSDVCSSDLGSTPSPRSAASFSKRTRRNGSSPSLSLPIAGCGMSSAVMITPYPVAGLVPATHVLNSQMVQHLHDEIGRASCRERVLNRGVGG